MPPMFKQDQETGGKQKMRKFVNSGQQSKVFSATVMTLTVYLYPLLWAFKVFVEQIHPPFLFNVELNDFSPSIQQDDTDKDDTDKDDR